MNRAAKWYSIPWERRCDDFNTAFFQPCREPLISSGKRYHWGWRCHHWCISVLSGKKSYHRFAAGGLPARTGAGMADLCRLLCKLQHYKSGAIASLSGLYHIREMDAGKEKESSLNLTFLKKIPWLEILKMTVGAVLVWSSPDCCI